MSEVKPFTVSAEQSRAIWHMGALMQFRATSADTGNQFWLAEQTSHQGYASPLHVHSKEDETFHVLDGEVSIEIDGVLHNAGPGTTVFAPRGLPHSYKVESPVARWLVLGTPGGFDGWFFDTGKPAERLEVPAFDPADFPDFGDVIASVQRYGGQVLGPPRA
ncbi:cupin domain-containing protein [Lentzea nigeriaca]|uniref:cupin domain-containing protein n=1 Tax=Lentzea nigeriaca TaxID=1128665 RepID=UPI001957452B|nr:cupin domain-containing protein [Lentzea nigeriaca]MBM7856363.1 quercetin dioxygenase-like cupin family protein [Lentzea nigeriaca]